MDSEKGKTSSALGTGSGQASLHVDGDSQQEGASESSEGCLRPSVRQLSQQRAGIANSTRRAQNKCSCCGREKPGWKKDVCFTKEDARGSETGTVIAGALFDTGTEYDNLISLEFIIKNGFQFERHSNVREKRSLWKRIVSKLLRRPVVREPRRTADDGSLVAYRTATGDTVNIVGMLKNARWRGPGPEEAQCARGLQLPFKFLCSDFLVVENLQYDVIFSARTMAQHELIGLPRIIAAFRAIKPKPVQGSNAFVRQQLEISEQDRIRREQRAAEQSNPAGSQNNSPGSQNNSPGSQNNSPGSQNNLAGSQNTSNRP